MNKLYIVLILILAFVVTDRLSDPYFKRQREIREQVEAQKSFPTYKKCPKCGYINNYIVYTGCKRCGSLLNQ